MFLRVECPASLGKCYIFHCTEKPKFCRKAQILLVIHFLRKVFIVIIFTFLKSIWHILFFLHFFRYHLRGSPPQCPVCRVAVRGARIRRRQRQVLRILQVPPQQTGKCRHTLSHSTYCIFFSVVFHTNKRFFCSPHDRCIYSAFHFIMKHWLETSGQFPSILHIVALVNIRKHSLK